MKIPNQLIYPQGVQKHQHLGSFNYCIFKILFLYLHQRKINIIINRPRTGSQNLFLMTITKSQITLWVTLIELLMLLVTLLNPLTKSQIWMDHTWELSIPNSGSIQDDEQDEDMISQYTNIYNAIEKWDQTTGKQKSSNNLPYQNYLTN